MDKIILNKIALYFGLQYKPSNANRNIVSGLVTSALKFCCVLVCVLCIRKFYCVLEKIAVHQEKSLCSGKDCCVPESIVVFSKRLLCSEKDCCNVQKIVVFFKRRRAI